MFTFMLVYVCVCACLSLCLSVCVCRVSVRLSVLVLVLCGLDQIYYFSACEEVRFVPMFMYVGRRLRRRAPRGSHVVVTDPEETCPGDAHLRGDDVRVGGHPGVARGGYRPRRVLSR